MYELFVFAVSIMQTMFNAGEILEVIPSATMDEETMQIPITEYEKFRNYVLYQDKQSLIREMQQLLQDKDEDLQRYKEKLEQSESVRHRTQKQLDNCMQFKNSDKPIKVLVPRSINRLVSKHDDTPKVIARALGSDTSREATEHDETCSIPSSRISTDNNYTKSLPLAGFSMTGFAPGLSSALLQKLVTENLRLRKQLESLNGGKPVKLATDTEIQDLKSQLTKKQDQYEDLRNQLRLLSVQDNTETTSSDSPAKPAINAWLMDKLEKYEKTLEMNNVIISSLKEEKERVLKEKSDVESVLAEYRKYDRKAENKYNEDRIMELEQELELLRKSRENTSSKLESVQLESDSWRHRFEEMEQHKDIAVKNYEVLCKQFQTPISAGYHSQNTGRISAQAFMPSSSSFADSALSSSLYQSDFSNPTLPPRPDSLISHPSRHIRTQAEPPLPPRMQPQHRNATAPQQPARRNTTAASPLQAPVPQARDKRILKCPRCETVFDLLQSYREHIKVCLKSST